jgi:hypothetical protein
MCAGSIPAGGILTAARSRRCAQVVAPPADLVRESRLRNRRELVRAMQIPGAHIVTLQNPVGYTSEQIDRACAIAHHLQRGQFVLCEPPRRPLD